MRKILKNRIIINLISSVLFGGIYSLLSYADKNYVEYDKVLRMMVFYFLGMSLLYYIAPKLRKSISGKRNEE